MDKPVKGYKYQKDCQLSRCGKRFGTNRKWQDFCEDSHRVEYHLKELKDIRSLFRRLEKLEAQQKKDYKRLDEAFKKAAEECQKLAALLSSKKGGEGVTEKKKESNG